jgi:hypothetical protein
MTPLEVGARAFILALEFIESQLDNEDERKLAREHASKQLRDNQLMALRAAAQELLDERHRRD